MAYGATQPDGGDDGLACPPGFHKVSGMCVPDEGGPVSEVGGGGDTGPCPPGQVRHCYPPPCRCEAPDALSKADQDTCDEGAHPQDPSPDCYWCDFDTQQWKRGMCPWDAPGVGGGGGARAAAPAAKGGAVASGRSGGFPASPYELALSAIMGELGGTLNKMASDVYGISLPAFSEGVDYYRTLLGRGGRGRMQAATAPAQEQIAAGAEGAVRGLGSGYLRGGARDQAVADIRRGASGDIAHLTQGVQPGAADRLIQAGGAGVGQAGSLETSAANVFGNLANLAVSSRLSSEGMDLQQELGLKGLQLQRDLGFAGLDLQYKQLAASMAQFSQSFGLQSALGFGGLQLSRDQMAQNASQFTQQLASNEKIARQQTQQQTGAGFGSLLGTLGAAAIGKCSQEFKEAITEAVELSEGLRRVVEEMAPALRSWRYREGMGELAGHEVDNGLVLELAPRYGALPDAAHPVGRVLNLPQVLGDLAGAVAALAAENRQLRTRLEGLEEVERG